MKIIVFAGCRDKGGHERPVNEVDASAIETTPQIYSLPLRSAVFALTTEYDWVKKGC